jgi:hypothetical protein
MRHLLGFPSQVIALMLLVGCRCQESITAVEPVKAIHHLNWLLRARFGESIEWVMENSKGRSELALTLDRYPEETRKFCQVLIEIVSPYAYGAAE